MIVTQADKPVSNPIAISGCEGKNVLSPGEIGCIRNLHAWVSSRLVPSLLVHLPGKPWATVQPVSDWSNQKNLFCAAPYTSLQPISRPSTSSNHLPAKHGMHFFPPCLKEVSLCGYRFLTDWSLSLVTASNHLQHFDECTLFSYDQ